MLRYCNSQHPPRTEDVRHDYLFIYLTSKRDFGEYWIECFHDLENKDNLHVLVEVCMVWYLLGRRDIVVYSNTYLSIPAIAISELSGNTLYYIL